jgi:predicted MFS family arabinose efflux permease
VAPEPETLRSSRLWLGFATMLLVSGLTNTFPVFLPPLLAEFGGSRAATASAASIWWIGGAALGPLAGLLVARRDPRVLVTVGLAAAAAGLALGTAARSLPAFVATVGVGGALGVGLTGMVTQAALVASAYTRRRGLAMGIAFSGSMAAYALAAPAQWVITHLGWRAAFWAYALAIAALVPWAWRAYPRRLHPAARAAGGPAGPPLRAIVGSVPFWSLFLLFSTPPLFGYLATTQHALYFTERGYSAGVASLLLTAGGVLAGSGRALAGWLADRLGAPVAGTLSFTSSLLGVLCLLGMEWTPSPALAAGYVLFVFLPLGSRATIVSVLTSRIAAPAHYGVVFGLLGIGNNLGAAAGPWLSGAIYDRTHSYAALYLTALAVGLVGLSSLGLFCASARRAGGWR